MFARRNIRLMSFLQKGHRAIPDRKKVFFEKKAQTFFHRLASRTLVFSCARSRAHLCKPLLSCPILSRPLSYRRTIRDFLTFFTCDDGNKLFGAPSSIRLPFSRYSTGWKIRPIYRMEREECVRPFVGKVFSELH